MPPPVAERITIPAGRGHAVALGEGAAARIVLTEGPQVVDVWAFRLPGLQESLSTEHTRSCLEKLIPAVGDALYSNRRRPILRLVEDTSPGVHDLLLSACDQARYELLGHDGPHANCADNLEAALNALGRSPPEIPSPLNLFERVVIDDDGALRIAPPPARAGEHVTLRAECDLVLALSACPMDIAPTNGPDCRPKPVALEILR